MSRREGLVRKRPRQSSDGLSNALTNDEQAVYDIIQSRGGMGIWRGDLKRELNNMKMVDQCIKSLVTKNKVREVKSVQNRGKIHLVAADIEPSKELTGGDWYSDGNLDTGFVEILQKLCIGAIRSQKVATPEGILEAIRRQRVINVPIKIEQIQQILNTMKLDNEIDQLTSNGIGDLASIPIGEACYRIAVKHNVGRMTSIPCGACPHIHECTPDGVISPSTCVYYNKWLDIL